ncbi:hypothetical protein DPX16_21822 [Anabarilius grahami]|uniref:Uncharacterized protein n=1 Tax=Anabarilius grahami TaxID=495550 RepID=A0A3N0YQ54_ANAGA|nr:hypothetical protein DPX16_21822 [Anabarilius grahami]
MNTQPGSKIKSPKSAPETSEPPGADEDELLDDDDVRFLTSSHPAASRLLAAVYAELLEFVGRASGRLQLPWGCVKKGAARGQFDERFLSVHSSASPDCIGEDTSTAGGLRAACRGDAGSRRLLSCSIVTTGPAGTPSN